MPKNSNNNHEAYIELNEKYLEGICDMEVGEEYMILFHFNKCYGYELKVPFKGDGPIMGVFSTHAPNRPNPIGVSNIKITEINGNKIKFKGVDMLDNTPVLDIKDLIK